MTKDEEDALANEFTPLNFTLPAIIVCIRLAIRAAVASERERCAKVCEDEAEGLAWSDKDALNGARDCADAIRRGGQ